jgi:tetratricopeptide (TPR) repeat protein
MKLIEFPSELVVFSNRIDSHWQTKLQTSLSEKQVAISELTLKDWYSELQVILSSEEKLPSTLWAIAAKLAWLQADVSFFIDYSDVIEAVRDEPLFLCYYGAGVSEFIDLEKGLDLIEEGISHLESSKDSHALFDISIPYTLILNNSKNKESLRKFYHKIKQLFEEKKLEIEFDYNLLIASFNCCRIFASKKKSEKEYLEETLQIALKSQHHLIAGLVYSSLAKWEEETSNSLYQKNMEACLKQYQTINARYRSLIAYTNYAHFFSSKVNYEESSRYLSKAFKLAEEIIESPEDGPGLYVYPLIGKAWIQIEQGKLNEALGTLQLALGKANDYNNIYYQVKVEYDIAYVFFLLMKYDLSLNHAENALSLTEKLPTKQLQYAYRLEYADILTDLNKFNKVENTLDTIDPNDLEGCSKVQYDYVKGKFELNRHNLGTSKQYFERAINNIEECSHLRALLLFTLSEEYIREFRLSEDPKILQEAQEMIEEGLEGIHDVPTRTKGKIISAILLSAQDRHEEAEEILESLISPSVELIPHFRDLAVRLLDNIRDSRISRVSISPITNFKDVIRYLRDAKTSIESPPR